MHLFGGTWPLSCASYALRRVAIDHKTEDNEEVCKAIERNFYVDDIMKSTKTKADAILLVHKLIELLERGGFALNKWLRNRRIVLQSIPPNKRAKSVKDLSDKLVVLPLECTLGMFWNVKTDVFCFYINQANKPHTRRGVLSVTCSIFDPCGFLAPFVLKAKMLIQDLTRKKLGWDELIHRAEDELWQCCEADLGKLLKFKVKRALKPASLRIKHCELIHFADESQRAYGAVSYVRFIDCADQIHVAFLMAKARLAPFKRQTIPRPELMAAVKAVR